MATGAGAGPISHPGMILKRQTGVIIGTLPRSECLVLSSCEERSQPGVVSGYKGCSLHPSKITLYNRHGIMTCVMTYVITCVMKCVKKGVMTLYYDMCYGMY